MKTLSLWKLYALGLAPLFLALSAHAQIESSFYPAKDNTVFEEGNLSNGAGVHLYAGWTGSSGNNNWRNALIQFDLSNDIPAGSVIESAELSMHVNQAPIGEASNSRIFTIHRLESDWGEGTSNAGTPGGQGAEATTGDATWLYAFYPSVEWPAPSEGGDFTFAPSASASISGQGTYIWTGEAMAADVQKWIENPQLNYGWIIIGPTVEKTARRFDSREATDPNLRPMLTVTYNPPPTHWAGYPVLEDGRTVDTMDYLGLVDIYYRPWIYVYSMQKWIYQPESSVTASGGWGYITK